MSRACNSHSIDLDTSGRHAMASSESSSPSWLCTVSNDQTERYLRSLQVGLSLQSLQDIRLMKELFSTAGPARIT